MDESLEFHLRGLQQYKSTIGSNHHRTGDLCVKVSDHYVRVGQYDAAMYDTPVFYSLCVCSRFGTMLMNEIRSLLDQALKIYGDREYFGPEKARALYKKGKLLGDIGNDGEAYLKRAMNLYQDLKKGCSDPRRGIDELSDADFDQLIVFWSK